MGLRSWLVIVGACVLALGPLTSSVGAAPDQALPAPAVDIRSIRLRDQHGQTTTLRAFQGRMLVVHFIFTHCAAACHTQVKSLKAVREALPPDIRSRVTFLSISLDPARDTPRTLREYAKTMRVEDPAWRFVAPASPAQIVPLTQSLGVKRARLADGQLDHTLVVFLFDPVGQVLQRYVAPQVNTARLVREIGEVVRLYGSPKEATPSDSQRR